MFEILFESADILVSFFYNFMFLEYNSAVEFLKGIYNFQFVSLVNEITISLTLPTIPIIGNVFNVIIDLFSLLFLPLDFLAHNPSTITPFYLCFISFLVRGVFILGFLKLVSFVVELIPFE